MSNAYIALGQGRDSIIQTCHWGVIFERICGLLVLEHIAKGLGGMFPR